MGKHKHHIIPVYHCKELGIDPDFDENYVMVERLDHARIHWGYKCDDLEPLFEYITPAQWIIDLIPIGDKRDIWAAQINARGEIDGIDQSGENHHMYGKTHSPEARKKISIANRGDKNGMFGKKHTPETIESMRQAKLGKTASKETREKLSKMRKGKATWNKGKKCPQLQGDKNGNFGKIPWNKGKSISEETRKKLSESNKGKAPWNKGTGMTKEERNRKQRESRAKNKAETGFAMGYSQAKKKAETQGEGTLKAFLK
tara:strand:+ start:338 stop:1111 length:774 start_codon:yes stop_codon:yes gene_type:complete